MQSAAPPEHNVTGQDFADRRHLHYAGPIVDVHAHVMRTRRADSKDDAEWGIAQAETMLDVAAELGVAQVYSMCPPEDISSLRQRFGDRLRFNGPISKKAADAPDDDAYRLLDRFLELGIHIIKFWAAPRGRERGLLVDAAWRIEAARRARAAGVRVVMVHVGDPDVWFRTVYADTAKFGSKADQYVGLVRMMEMFPDMTWIAAHMGGDPEHADHLEALLERHTNLYLDTSATKWQVREVSAHRDALRSLILRRPERFLFGSDLVTRHGLPREHYVSRYWSQRTLWESSWEGRSPIADPDYATDPGGPATPLLRSLDLPADVLDRVYRGNALRILPEPTAQAA
jgi:hypothetical protein